MISVFDRMFKVIRFESLLFLGNDGAGNLRRGIARSGEQTEEKNERAKATGFAGVLFPIGGRTHSTVSF